MFFRVTVKNLETVLGRLGRVRSAFKSKAVMNEIGNFLRKQILVRTARGEDVDGNRFTDYSDGYKLFRKAHGRPVGKVNLFFSGTMLSSIDTEVKERSVRLFFQPTEAPPVSAKTDRGKPKESPKSPVKAYFLHHHKTKPRRFFAYSQADVEEIVLKILQRTDKEMGT